MGRKHKNARTQPKRFRIAKNHHFLYSTDDEFGTDATVVRFLGDQEGDYLYCFHPEGFAMWIHVHQLSNPIKQAA